MSIGYPDSGTVSLDRPKDLPPGKEWSGTFGSFVPCLTTAGGPARITGIELGESSGPAPAVAYVRTFDSATDTPVGSMLGDARDLDIGSSRLREGVVGLEVGTRCHDLIGFDGATTDEILISLTADERGAHVGDVTLAYVTADGGRHAVRAAWDLTLCGTEVPERFGCPD